MLFVSISLINSHNLSFTVQNFCTVRPGLDKLSAMRTFAAVARAGSFSAAARSLSLPKTRVSQRVQDLEAALAIRLFHRTTRVVSLTEEGRFYLEKCTQILEEIDSTEQALGRTAEDPSGRLRLSCMSLVAQTLILPRLDHFLTAYPKVTLSISVSDRIVNLQEAGFDCAIRGGALDSSSLISRPLGDARFALYAAPAWLARHGPIATPADLAHTPLIKILGQRDGALRHWSLINGAERIEETSPARLEADDDHAGLVAALGGAGVVLSASFAADPHVSAGRLARILPGWTAPSRPVYAIYPTRRYVSARLRCFLNWVAPLIRQA